MVSLSKNSYIKLSKVKLELGLDFDDAYQYLVAEENAFSIITLDSDFIKIKNKIEIIFV